LAGSVVLLLVLGCGELFGSGCSRFATEVFPRIGTYGMQCGTWVDSRRFVLVDAQRSRLLLFNTANGFVRAISGHAAGEVEFTDPVCVQPWSGGFVLADAIKVESGYKEPRLVALDRDLRTTAVLWEGSPTLAAWRSELQAGNEPAERPISALYRMTTAGDGAYVLTAKIDDPALARFATEPGSDTASLVVDQEWLAEEGGMTHLNFAPLRLFAETRGSAAGVFVLRFFDGPLIQRVAGDGFERLAAFPEMPGPLQPLVQVRSVGDADAYMRYWRVLPGPQVCTSLASSSTS